MKKLLTLLLAGALLAPAPALATHVARPIPQAPKQPVRGPVEVHRGFPIQRPPVNVYRPHHRRQHHPEPRHFLPLVVWPGLVVAAPRPAWVLWQEQALLSRGFDWTELYFDVGERGRQLVLELDGQAQLDFVELVYEDGTATVIDFGRAVRLPGSYEVLALRPELPVATVRVVVRTPEPRLRLGLRLVR